MRHTKKVSEKFSLEKMQDVNWQYSLTQVIKLVNKSRNEVVNDAQNLHIFENIFSNYRVQGRIYGVFYQEITESFKRYLESLDFDKIQTLNLDLAVNGGGIQWIKNYLDAVELLQAFDLFYYINSRLPYTTCLLPIPDADFPAFVDGQKISIKKLYEDFLWDAFSWGCFGPVFMRVKSFLAGDLSYSKNKLCELYYNLCLQVLSDEYELSENEPPTFQ